jgi:uracil-DNA glycosylase
VPRSAAVTGTGLVDVNGAGGWRRVDTVIRTPQAIERKASDVAETPGVPASGFDALEEGITGCRRCPRLVAWREEVAATRRASFRDQRYWGRPVPGFGSLHARIGILGLAPAAHGGNRTGRIFTGDRSGDFLFAALHRVGLANQPGSVAVDDGLEVRHTRLFAALRCAPPGNHPTPAERDQCAPWLHREMILLRPTLQVVVALGGFAWSAFWPALHAVYGLAAPRPRPSFGHGVEHGVGGDAPVLVGCYHVSQQNTFTGRLTPPMLDKILIRARQLAGLD